MITKCVKCGKTYQLDSTDNINDFQCECGSNLEERRTLKDVKRTKQEEKLDKQLMGLSSDNQKRNLISRGYQLVDETESEYIYSKNKRVLPVVIIVVMAIVFLPLALLYFWKKPVLKTVDKNTNLTLS